jgi:hypothetical protein
VREADAAEAAGVLAFADQIAGWYAMRLSVAGTHPMAQDFWQHIERLRVALDISETPTSSGNNAATSERTGQCD